jgi:hypothetical protein
MTGAKMTGRLHQQHSQPSRRNTATCDAFERRGLTARIADLDALISCLIVGSRERLNQSGRRAAEHRRAPKVIPCRQDCATLHLDEVEIIGDLRKSSRPLVGRAERERIVWHPRGMPEDG